ncbi:MAG: ABC-F family ATP-binding cassette domain-containing protein [Spirochaetales bacterium]|nr:ABC-F family ATP-binding cassette domain-containing protein [Spirochaetales bacterium]
MSLLSVNNLSKAIGGKILFEDITFGVQEGQKLAIIGNNGCGKSTLLKILAGKEGYDEGRIIKQKELKIAFLGQNPDFSQTETILDYIFRSDSPEIEIIKNYEQCLEEVANGCEKSLQRLNHYIETIDHKGLWNLETQIKSILCELGIEKTHLLMRELSGGMAKKVALAAVLIQDFDLLLLDEPTNHLDIQTIKWLENYLQGSKKAQIFVTHDRYFLEKICTNIVEIEDLTLYKYDGNYSDYLYSREVRIHNTVKAQEKLNTALRREYEWIKRGPKARSCKDKKRSSNYYEMVEKKEEMTVIDKSSEFSVNQRRLGNKVLNIENVSKSYGELNILKKFSYKFNKGDKIGIIGPNGSGKTTLLNIIADRLPADSGRIELGINTHIGYFDQTSQKIPEEMTVLEYIREKALEVRKSGESTMSPEKMLESFMFENGSYNTLISKLSGGEKRRLYLIRILLENPNFLIMDEPTNDFDIKTLSMIEDFLSQFDGCLAIVSHDRYFIDRTTDFLLALDGNGEIHGFVGSVDDYYEQAEEKPKQIKESQKPEPTAVKRKKQGLSYNEKREFEAIEEEIEKLESEKSEIETFFSSGESNPEVIAKKTKRYAELEKNIEAKYQRWEELEAKSNES